jgi:hypothetical protein
MSSRRNFREEYRSESPARKKARAARNRARLKVYKSLKEKYGAAKAKKLLKNKDVDHINPLVNKVTEKKQSLKNLRLRDPSENRGDKSFLKKKKKV